MKVFDNFIIEPFAENGLTITAKSEKLCKYFESKNINTTWFDIPTENGLTEVCRYETQKGLYPLSIIRTAINHKIIHSGFSATGNGNMTFGRHSIPNLVFLSFPSIKDGVVFTYEKPFMKGELSMFLKSVEYYIGEISKAVSNYFEKQYQTVVNPMIELEYNQLGIKEVLVNA